MTERDFMEVFRQYGVLVPRNRVFGIFNLTSEQKSKATALMEDFIAGRRSKPVSDKELGQPDMDELLRVEKERGIRILI